MKKYEKALESLSVSAGESVLIDDMKENLAVPAKMGFHTIFYDHEKNDCGRLCLQLKNLGVTL